MKRAIRNFKWKSAKQETELWKICTSRDPRFHFPAYTVSDHGNIKKLADDSFLKPTIQQGKPTARLENEQRKHWYYRQVAGIVFPVFAKSLFPGKH